MRITACVVLCTMVLCVSKYGGTDGLLTYWTQHGNTSEALTLPFVEKSIAKAAGTLYKVDIHRYDVFVHFSDEANLTLRVADEGFQHRADVACVGRSVQPLERRHRHVQ